MVDSTGRWPARNASSNDDDPAKDFPIRQAFTDCSGQWIRAARALQRLRQLLKGVDRRAMVHDQSTSAAVAWNVTDN